MSPSGDIFTNEKIATGKIFLKRQKCRIEKFGSKPDFSNVFDEITSVPGGAALTGPTIPPGASSSSPGYRRKKARLKKRAFRMWSAREDDSPLRGFALRAVAEATFSHFVRVEPPSPELLHPLRATDVKKPA